MVDTIISKSAYLWDLMKLFYIEIYDLLCAKVELIIKNSYNYFKNKELKLDILFFDVDKKEFVDKNIEL